MCPVMEGGARHKKLGNDSCSLSLLKQCGSSVGAPSWTSGPALLGPELFPGCQPHAPLLGLVAAVAGGIVWLCPQDLQDHNDELQAALQGLRAQTAPSRHSHLPLGHGPAGRRWVLGGGASVGRWWVTCSCPGDGVVGQPAAQGSQVRRTTCVGEGSYLRPGVKASQSPKGDGGGRRSYCLDRVSGEGCDELAVTSGQACPL